MNKLIVKIAVFFILLSIILGAMAAHSLEKIIEPDLINTFEKGVKYLMYSGLGLLILGFNQEKLNFNIKWTNRLIIIGSILFSGNIFLYTFHEQIPALKNFVHIVPVGGLLMIIGWTLLFVQLIKSK